MVTQEMIEREIGDLELSRKVEIFAEYLNSKMFNPKCSKLINFQSLHFYLILHKYQILL